MRKCWGSLWNILQQNVCLLNHEFLLAYRIDITAYIANTIHEVDLGSYSINHELEGLKAWTAVS